MCKNCGESIDHLFLHGEVAIKMLNVLLQLEEAFWCCLGYALQSEQVVGKLERTVGKPSCIAHMEDCSIVF